MKFIKGDTLVTEKIPPQLIPVAVVYARQGERVLIVSLENASGSSQRWAYSYEVALSGFDLAAGGTIVLTLGSGSVAANISIPYSAGATLTDVASAINSTLKGTPDYTSVNYGGWTATRPTDSS